MPDRVIDAPIPDDLETLHMNATYYLCDIAFTGGSVRALIERISRLEAEKQAAHTEGWNAAIKAAAEHCMQLGLLPSTKDGSQTLRNVAFGITRVLSNPTAAKPEPSPSSANRAEGRQG